MSNKETKIEKLAVGGKDLDSGLNFQIGGTSKSSLPWPKMTTVQRDALPDVKTGYTIFNTDTNQVNVYSDGSWGTLSGGGAGEINYIDQFDAESTITDWTASGNLTITVDATASEVLRGTKSFKISKPASNENGETVSVPFTIDEADKNKLLKLQMVHRSSANYVSGYFEVEIYDVDNAQTISVSVPEVSHFDNSQDGSATFPGSFVSSESSNYELRLKVNTTTTTAWDFWFDNVIVGPGSIVTGAVIGTWQEYTPTYLNDAGLTITPTALMWKQDGEDILIRGSLSIAGTGTDGGNFYMSMPNNYTRQVNDSSVGPVQFLEEGGAVDPGVDGLARTIGSTNPEYIYFQGNDPSTGTTNSLNGSSFGDISGKYRAIYLNNIRIPVDQLVGAGTVNLGVNDVEYVSNSDSTSTATNTTSFSYGPQGEVIPNGAVGTTYRRDIQFSTPIQATDKIEVEVNDGDGWAPVVNRLGAPLRQGSSRYGVLIDILNDTNVSVLFQKQGYEADSTYGANGADWSGLSTAGWKWRVVKHRAGIPVGFGLATADNAGLVPSYGSDSGAGEINYIEYWNAENGLGDWAASGNLTIEVDATASEVLRGTKSFKISKPASNENGETVSIPFTIDEADKNKLLKLQMVHRSSTNYVSGYLETEIYDVDNAQTISVSVPEVSHFDNSLDGAATYPGTWVSSVDASNYELRLKVNTATTTSWDFWFDNVIVGPGSVATGATIGPWTNYTPSDPSAFSSSVSSGRWKQVGSDIVVEASWTLNSAVTGTIRPTWAEVLPSGYTVDLSTYTATIPVGNWYSIDNNEGASFNENGGVLLASSTILRMIIPRSNSTSGSDGDETAAGQPFTWASGDVLQIRFSVPIAEWAGSGTVNLGVNDVEYVASSSTFNSDDADSSNTVYGPDGASINEVITASLRAKKIQFQSPIQPTDTLTLEIQQGGVWHAVGNSALAIPYAQQSTLYYGAGFVAFTVGSNEATIRFGRYRAYGTGGFGTAGADWDSFTDRWRVVKHRAGIPVGFGLATADNAGLVKKTTKSLVRAYVTASSISVGGSGTHASISFAGETVDLNGDFDTSSYFFTAPRTGYYRFHLQGDWSVNANLDANEELSLKLWKNDVPETGTEVARCVLQMQASPSTFSGAQTQHLHSVLYLMSGDTIYPSFGSTAVNTQYLLGSADGETSFTVEEISSEVILN